MVIPECALFRHDLLRTFLHFIGDDICRTFVSNWIQLEWTSEWWKWAIFEIKSLNWDFVARCQNQWINELFSRQNTKIKSISVFQSNTIDLRLIAMDGEFNTSARLTSLECYFCIVVAKIIWQLSASFHVVPLHTKTHSSDNSSKRKRSFKTILKCDLVSLPHLRKKLKTELK